jgi:hypothetical protein
LGVLEVEMEGSYYQRNHSIGFKMQKSVPHDIKKLRICVLCIRCPLETGILASGGLGTTGVKPTYLITIKREILEQIFNVNKKYMNKNQPNNQEDQRLINLNSLK